MTYRVMFHMTWSQMTLCALLSAGLVAALQAQDTTPDMGNTTMPGITTNQSMSPGHGNMGSSNGTMDSSHGNMVPGTQTTASTHQAGSPPSSDTSNSGPGSHNMGGTGGATMHAPGGDGSGNMASKMMHYGYFHVTYQTVILFEEWVTSTWRGFLGSCIGICIATILSEGFKVLRQYLLKKTKKTSKKTLAQRMFSWQHLLQSLLYVIQMIYAYLIMLIIMTFNIWYCVSIALGFFLGYFFFGVPNDDDDESVSANGHCM